jgi:hypothetical protein
MISARIIGPQECDQRRFSGPIEPPARNRRGHMATALVFMAIGWGAGVLCGLAA